MADGRTLLQRCVDTLAALDLHVVVLAREAESTRAASGDREVQVMLDEIAPEAQGPLVALVEALRWARGAGYERACVLGADLPGVHPEDLRSLRARADGPTPAVVAWDGEHTQPLVGWYRPALVADALAEAVRGGERRLVRAVEALQPARVRLSRRALTNVNTVRELAAIEAMEQAEATR